MQVTPSPITEFWFEKEATINWYTKPVSINLCPARLRMWDFGQNTWCIFVHFAVVSIVWELVSNEAFKNHDSGDDFVSMLRLMSLS